MPKALKVTEETIDYIVDYAKTRGFTLDYMRDNMEYHAEDGFELYCITDGSVELRNVTFSTFTHPDFFLTWKFSETENPTQFAKIERV